MFVRIARFEGGTAKSIEAEAAAAQADIAAVRRGEPPKLVPAELIAAISRVTMLHHRADGASAMLVYSDTAEAMATADRILNSMSPQNAEMGRRASVQIYEVAVDEVMR